MLFFIGKSSASRYFRTWCTFSKNRYETSERRSLGKGRFYLYQCILITNRFISFPNPQNAFLFRIHSLVHYRLYSSPCSFSNNISLFTWYLIQYHVHFLSNKWACSFHSAFLSMFISYLTSVFILNRVQHYTLCSFNSVCICILIRQLVHFILLRMFILYCLFASIISSYCIRQHVYFILHSSACSLTLHSSACPIHTAFLVGFSFCIPQLVFLC